MKEQYRVNWKNIREACIVYMPVYIDDYNAPYGRMIMCHMMADTHQELVNMAVHIGIHTKWIQKEGTIYEHFDVCLQMKQRAIKLGAVQMTAKEMVKKLIMDRRSSV